MSQIPRRFDRNSKPHIVTASTTVTKQDPAANVTHNTQRTRVAQIRSCCGGSRAVEGARSQLPQPGFSGFRQSQIPQPPPCCITKKSAVQQPCSSRSQIPSIGRAVQPPRRVLQSGFADQTQSQAPQPIKSVQQKIPVSQNRSLSAPTSRNINLRSDMATVKKSVPQIPRSTSQIVKQSRAVPQGTPKLSRTRQSLTRDPLPARPFGYEPLKSALKQPTKLDSTLKSELLNKSAMKPLTKVTAKAKQVAKAPYESIETPSGMEPVLQKAVFEKRIHRDEQGEALIKNVVLTKLNDQNEMDYVEMGIQQLDPQFAKIDGTEIVGVTSTISISPSYATVSKDYIRALTEEKKDIGMSPDEVAQLIEEEKEDVDNTLKMIPPELFMAPGKYELKQRLQQLRLNSESVALLEQSIIQPEITPDEAQQEPTPEAMGAVMHTVETGITPDVTPDQVFNSLFREPPTENFISLSSVTPGPLQDVVVPSAVPKEIHKEAVTNEMSKLTEKLNAIQPGDIPYSDIFSKVMDDAQKSPEQGKTKTRTFETITDEKSLWVNANLEHLVNVVGAEPVEVLDPLNLEELEQSENFEAVLANGMEYFVESNPVQYMNRVQLRGSQLPSYFPGYMVAVPDFPDLIKLARSPDEVFAVGWKSVQPKYFEEESMMSLF